MNEEEFEKELADVNEEIASMVKKKEELEHVIDDLRQEREKIMDKYVASLGTRLIGKTYRNNLAGTFLIVKELTDGIYFKCLEVGLPGRNFLGNHVAGNYLCHECEILGTLFVKKEYDEVPRSEFDQVVDEFINGSGMRMPVVEKGGNENA